MQKCVVFIEDWQIQCCGDPFKIGDNIEWTVWKWKKGFEESLDGVDFVYENHGSAQSEALFTLRATVSKIKARYYKEELCPDQETPDEQEELYPEQESPDERMFYRVYAKTVDVTEADGRDKDIDNMRFGSYVVTLLDCVVEAEPVKDD